MAQTVTDRWEAAIAQQMQKGMTRDQAIRAVIATAPELHRAYIKHIDTLGPRFATRVEEGPMMIRPAL